MMQRGEGSLPPLFFACAELQQKDIQGCYRLQQSRHYYLPPQLFAMDIHKSRKASVFLSKQVAVVQTGRADDIHLCSAK